MICIKSCKTYYDTKDIAFLLRICAKQNRIDDTYTNAVPIVRMSHTYYVYSPFIPQVVSGKIRSELPDINTALVVVIIDTLFFFFRFRL